MNHSLSLLLVLILLTSCVGRRDVSDFTSNEMSLVNDKQEIIEKEWQEGALIKIKTTSAIYKIQSEPLKKYAEDGIAVIRLKNQYAILQPTADSIYNVQHFDLAPNNASPNINRAIRFCAVQGGGTVYFPKGTYVLRKDSNYPKAFGAIRVLPGVSLKGDQAELMLRYATAFITVRSKGIYGSNGSARIIQDVVYGDQSVKVNNPNTFKAGDEVVLRIGDNEWDNKETEYGVVAKIKSVASNGILQLDRNILSQVKIAEVTNPNNLRVNKVAQVIRGVSVEGFKLVNDMQAGANARSGIDIRGAENITISDITAINPGAGALLIAYSSNVRADQIKVVQSMAQRKQRSKGRGINIWNSFDCIIEDFEIADFEGHVLFCESYAQNITLSNIRVMDNCPTRRKGIPYFFIGQGSEANLQNVLIQGRGNYPFVGNGGTVGKYTVHNLTLNLEQPIKGGLLLRDVSGKLNLYDPETNSCNYFDLSNAEEHLVKLAVSDSEQIEKFLPSGLIIDYAINTPKNSALQKSLEVYVGKEGIASNKAQRLNVSTKSKHRRQSANLGTDYRGSLEFDKKASIRIKTQKAITLSEEAIEVTVKIAPVAKQSTGKCAY